MRCWQWSAQLALRHAPNPGQPSILLDQHATFCCECTVYMAPEVFTREYSRSADMWSLGMMLYQFMSCRFPFWCPLLPPFTAIMSCFLRDSLLIRKSPGVVTVYTLENNCCPPHVCASFVPNFCGKF